MTVPADIDEELNEAAEELDLVNRNLRSTIDRLRKDLIKAKDQTSFMGEKLYEAMMDSAAAARFDPVVAPPKDKRRKGEEYGISVVSDWQLGKITKSYSSEVCEERIKQYTEKVIEITEIQRKDHPIKEHHVFMLGDMIEGELIFPGQSHLIDSSLFQQVAIDFPRIAKYMIQRLLETHDKVVVHTVWGNHGYLGGRSRKDMHPESNADNFAYVYLKNLFEHEPRVEFRVSREWYNTADLGDGLKFLLLHGNNIRGYNGLPWYGYYKKILGWEILRHRGLLGDPARVDEDEDTVVIAEGGFDYALTGHFHTPTSMYFNTVRVWVNGSTESHNAYAAEQLASMGEPSQYLLFAKPGKGITAEYLITLE